MEAHFIFPYPLNASGSGLLIQSLSKNLALNGISVHLLSVEFEPYTPAPGVRWSGMLVGDDYPLDVVPVYTGIASPHTTFAKLPPRDYPIYCDALRDHWQSNLKPQPQDVVIVSHLWTHATILKEAGIHVDGIMVHGTDLMAFQQSPAYQEQVTKASMLPSCLIANSQWTAQCCVNLGLGKGNQVICINPLIDTDVFKTSYQENSRPFPRVVYAPGKFVHFKGYDRFFNALPILNRLIPDVRIDVWGKGTINDSWYEMIGEMPNLTIHQEWISRPMLASRLRTASVAVVPSRNEPFGMIAAEALACGVPVVGDLSGGLCDIVSEERDGVLVDADNPQDLAASIASVISRADSPMERKARSHRLRKRFGIDATLANWQQWFSTLIRS